MSLKNATIFFLIIFASACYSQSVRTIHSVDILKIAQKNGKDNRIARLNTDSNGNVSRSKYKKEKVDLNSFSASLNELIAKEQKVVKVDGDNDERPGFHQPYNGPHLFITIIFQDDFDKEENLKNKTCYRYRETNLPDDQRDFSFFKYLNVSDLEIIKKFLQ